ncbi:MAG: hypothetical protein IKQ36_03035 [Clostridia bacterium]|nr:hypothetical protein [Clostridia bacterium]
MKRLTCEMCGSNNLLKQEGVYVCQDCGTKYSVEEAKKMMVEGSVEVHGTVKVDNSEKLERLYVLARRADDENNREMAAKYYEQVLVEDPMSWEASFYTTYFAAYKSDASNIEENVSKIFASAKTSVSLIRGSVSNPDDIHKAVMFIITRVSIFASNYFVPVIKMIYQYRNNGLDASSLKRAVIGMTDKSFSLATDMYEQFGTLIAIDKDGKDYPVKNFIDTFWNNTEIMFNSLVNCDLVSRSSGTQRKQEHDALMRKLDAAILEKKNEKERIAREEAQKRFDAYWLEHSAERASLESEKKSIESQITAINASLSEQVSSFEKELTAIPGATEIANLDERIKQLVEQKASLGIFKGKEKKALQEQIDQLSSEKRSVQNRIDAARRVIKDKIAAAQSEARGKITPLQSRINAINSELTKAR